MRYAIFDQSGKPTAFYEEDFPSIPQDAVVITDEQWSELLSDQRLKRFVDGQVITRALTQEEIDADNLGQVMEDIDKLEQVDKATLRILMNLCQVLIDKAVISGNDFSAKEKALYQQIKTLQGQIW